MKEILTSVLLAIGTVGILIWLAFPLMLLGKLDKINDSLASLATAIGRITNGSDDDDH